MQRKTLEVAKWCMYISIPVLFGYVIAGNEKNLEIIKHWFPSVASDRQGDHGRQLPTLQDEYRRFILEQTVDKALEDLRRQKAERQARSDAH